MLAALVAALVGLFVAQVAAASVDRVRHGLDLGHEATPLAGAVMDGHGHDHAASEGHQAVADHADADADADDDQSVADQSRVGHHHAGENPQVAASADDRMATASEHMLEASQPFQADGRLLRLHMRLDRPPKIASTT